jgi:hypothetical protein
MKFRFKDWVVCTDPFYQKLQAPGAAESSTNTRSPVIGEVINYVVKNVRGKKSYSYHISFDGHYEWIEETFLELYAGRDGPPFVKRG